MYLQLILLSVNNALITTVPDYNNIPRHVNSNLTVLIMFTHTLTCKFQPSCGDHVYLCNKNTHSSVKEQTYSANNTCSKISDTNA